jgi:hypothetical protein
MYGSFGRWLRFGIILIGMLSTSAISSPLDSSSVLGHVVSHQEKSFWRLRGYSVVGDRVVVTAIKMISIGQIDSLVDRTYILDPHTLDVLWFLDVFLGCGSTCDRCAEPCLACMKLPRNGTPGAFDIYSMTGELLQHESYESGMPSYDMHPAACSTPHGMYFYYGWSSSFVKFPVYDRSGEIVFNTSATGNWANDAFAFSDSIFLIPTFKGDPSISNVFLEVYKLPHEQPRDTIEIPAPGMVVEQLRVAMPPAGQAAVFYSYYGKMVAYIGSELELEWTVQPFGHVHHVAFSGNGQLIAIVGCPSPDYYKHDPELLLLAAESGQVLWQTRVESECEGGLGDATRCYFAGPYILFPGKDSCPLFLIDSQGQLIEQGCFPGKVDLLWINGNCITVSQSENDNNVIVSETWQR